MHFRLFVATGALALLLGGCAASEGTSSAEPAYDASITASLKLRLLTHLKTSGIHIHPHTANRVVTLRGKVVSRADKTEAVQLARSVEGVRDVQDELEIHQNF